MKKRLLSVLLLVCMVLTLLPTAALAGDMHEHEALPAAAHTHCYCGGSVNAGDHTSHEDVTYTAYNNASSLKQILKSDDVIYAYLTNNITLDRLYLPEGKTLYLCLNGHRITFDEYQVTLNNNTTLYLCDCSTEKTGTISRSAGKTSCVLVSGENATFNMYSGTLRNGNRSYGGGVNVSAGTMNMYGGTITENTATSDGGGIFVNTNGTLNLYGGTITKNTINVNEAHYGGGVYVESNKWLGVGKISISGSPVITGNTRTYTDVKTGAVTTSTDNLFLSHGFTNSGDLPIIKLGTLTSGANIGVSTKKATAFSTASETDYSDYFFSDDAGYHVEYNADKKLELKSGAAHVHTGGTAYCNKKALCAKCGNEYGEYDPNNHSGTLGEWQSDSTEHWKEYSCCHVKEEAGAHDGTATCTQRAVCSTCGREYGDLAPHDFAAAWGYQDETGHAHLCTNCGAHDTILPHTPDHEGHATEEYPILCTDCGYEIEAQLIHYHSYTQEVVKPEALKSAATCTARAVYYKSCTCGEVSASDSEIFESGDFAPHSFTAEKAAEEYLKSAATCTEKAVYYKSCTVCGKSSEGTADEATFTSGNVLGHDWGEPNYIWASTGDDYMCSATKVCQRCSTDVAEIATVSYAVTTAPTCLNTGTGTYTATFSPAYGFPAQTKTVTLPATGHSWGETEYIWTKTEDGYDCTAKRVCKNTDTHVETETVTADYSVKEAPTCLEPGLGKAVATFAADWATAGSTKDVTLAALGHDFGAWTSNGNGTHTRTCKRDASHTETGDCTGGTADCTNKAVCTVCGSAYGAKDPSHHTGKLAWDITETHHEQAWTCCGLITVAKAAHTFGDWVVTKRPTSREEGEKARTCSVCGYTETKVLPKTGGGPTYYTLVFESNGGSKITNVNERHGTVVDLTLAKYQPTRTGYDFTGWYSDKTLTRRVTSIKLYENTTVYAGWSTRELPFTDVGRGDWFFDDVRYVYETGLMNGVSATRFAPYGSTTRGMIVTILYRMEGQPSISRDCPFTDVASGSYYERAITWAAANGIVTGHSSTIFAPDASITREQLAAILYRYAVYKGLDVSVGENTNILSYEDFASLSEYAIPAMQWACGAGVLYGFGGSLLPDAPANRLQAAAILHRFCVNILN